MIFKRKEGFRFTFTEPVKAACRVMQNGQPLDPQASYLSLEIVDISPKGMKVAMEQNFEDALLNDIELQVIFCLDTVQLECDGEIVWKRRGGARYYYGLYFDAQEAKEQLIIDELKSRRRKEMKIADNSVRM